MRPYRPSRISLPNYPPFCSHSDSSAGAMVRGEVDYTDIRGIVDGDGGHGGTMGGPLGLRKQCVQQPPALAQTVSHQVVGEVNAIEVPVQHFALTEEPP